MSSRLKKTKAVLALKFKLTFWKSLFIPCFWTKNGILTQTHCTPLSDEHDHAPPSYFFMVKNDQLWNLKILLKFSKFDCFRKLLIFGVYLYRSWQRKQLYPNQGRIQKGCLAQEELFEVAQEALKCQLEIKVFSHWQDWTLLILFLRKLDLAPQCLKIIEKVSFNIVRYVYLEWTKVHWKCRK